MMFALYVSKEARDEAEDAYYYYEQQKIGLGDDFLFELEKCYQKLSKIPQAYSFIDNQKIVRDVCHHRFPYIVVYVVNNIHVDILSIRHTSRKPFTH